MKVELQVGAARRKSMAMRLLLRKRKRRKISKGVISW